LDWGHGGGAVWSLVDKLGFWRLTCTDTNEGGDETREQMES